jgi:hypothetical protein
MPSLDDAYRRVRQSKKRLFDLKGQIETFGSVGQLVEK